MSDRVLRDELEQLQKQALGLESQLSAHGPEFLAKRATATTALAQAREGLAGLERQLLTTKEEERSLASQVERLAQELKAQEQQRLDVLPFLFLPIAFGVAAVLLRSLPFGPSAFAAALSLGFLFGPRVLDWMQGGRKPLRSDSEARLALGLSLLTCVCAGWVLLRYGISGLEVEGGFFHLPQRDHFFLSLPVQLLAASGVLLALRARLRDGRRLASIAAVLSLLGLLVVSWTWFETFREVRRASPDWTLTFVPSSGLVALPALLLLWVAHFKPAQRSPLLLIGSLAFTALSLVLTWKLRQEAIPLVTSDLRALGASWAALQSGVGALILGWDFARREAVTSRDRWVGVVAAVSSLAAAGLCWLL